MRILFVNTNHGFVGGVERYLHRTAQLLVAMGWTVYGLFEKDAGYSEEFDQPFHSIYYDTPARRREILSLLRDVGVEVVFVHKIEDPDLMQQLNRGFKTISMVHDHDYYCLRKHKYFPYKRKNCYLPFNPVYCSICCGLVVRNRGAKVPFSFVPLSKKRALLEQMKKVKLSLVLSEYMRDNLLLNGWEETKIEKLYPIQVAKIPPERVSHYPAHLLYVGQLIRGKGVDLLLRAVKWVKEPFILQIVGTGNDEEFLQKLSKRYKLQDKVEFIGWTSNVEQYYKEADILIVPSRWQEPFGLIGLEAFAYRVPAIGFDIGGISEWLQDGVNGYLVPPEDIKMMAEKIDYLIQHKELRESMGQNGYEYVKKNFTEVRYWTSFRTYIAQLR